MVFAVSLVLDIKFGMNCFNLSHYTTISSFKSSFWTYLSHKWTVQILSHLSFFLWSRLVLFTHLCPPPPPPPPHTHTLCNCWHCFTFVFFFLSNQGFVPIGRFSEAGLLEWMRFVIFHARSRDWEVAAHFRADFWVGVASHCAYLWKLNLESRSSTNANTVAVAKITVGMGWREEKKSLLRGVRRKKCVWGHPIAWITSYCLLQDRLCLRASKNAFNVGSVKFAVTVTPSTHSKHWFTTSFLQGGRCQKAVLGVCAFHCEESTHRK